MNIKINGLLKEVEKLNNENREKVLSINDSIQIEMNKIFDIDLELKKDIQDHEESREYQYDTCGDIEKWSFAHNAEKYKEFEEFLNNWLEFITVEFNNSYHGPVFKSFEGESIIINHEGDIFEDDKVIINNDDYQDETDRNSQIETHMENTGCFPGIFESDYHGNLTPISTQEVKKT